MIDFFSFEAVSTLHVAIQVLAIAGFYTILILLFGLVFVILAQQTIESLSRFFRESSWFRIIRTTCLALFFGVAIAEHNLGHSNIFSGYVIYQLAMAVVSIIMIDLADQKEKAQEKEKEEENPPIQADESNDDTDKKEDEDEPLPRRRSQRKRKATVTFADQEEEEKATKSD